jgi:WD40 repeat protein
VTARLAVVNASRPAKKGDKVTGGVQWGCIGFRRDHGRRARFTSTPGGQSASTSTALLAAVDQRGHIYLFDMDANKYKLIARTGISGTAVALGVAKPNELIVGLSDRAVHCYNIETGAPIAKLTSHHENIVARISVHPSQPRVLTSSISETVLWDTLDWTRRQVLTGVDSVGVNQTEFSPSGDLIIANFRDDTLVMWNSETLEQVWKLTPDDFAVLDDESLGGITCFSMSSDGKLLATGGWGMINVWNVADQTVRREIIDERLQCGIVQMEFAARTTLLFVLNAQGRIIIFDAVSSFSKSVGLKPAKYYAISSDGLILSTLPINSPSFITMWSVETLLRAPSPTEEDFANMSTMSHSRRTSGASSPVIGPRSGAATPTHRSDDRRLSGASASRVPLRSTTSTVSRSNRLSGQPSVPRNVTGGSMRSRNSLSGTASRPSLGRDALSSRRMSDAPTRTITSSTSRTAVQRREQLNASPTPTDASNDANRSVLDSDIDLTQSGNPELARENLVEILEKRGRFPRDYRTLIWRFLLRLPQNQETFRYLVSKGTHPCVERFRERFSMQNRKLQLAMERMVSLLVHWHPEFETLDYMPYLVFPFVKMMGDDLLSCFELVTTLMLNWGQGWWERFPNPPKTHLQKLDELLDIHDVELLEHFRSHVIPNEIYGWIPLQSLFSEVLCKEDWARLWDHCFTREPSFLYFFAAALLIGCRDTLLSLRTEEEFEDMLHQPQPVNVLDLVDLAKRLEAATPIESSPFAYHTPFTPLPAGEYPSPIRNSARRSSQLRARAIKEEMELLRSRLSAI